MAAPEDDVPPTDPARDPAAADGTPTSGEAPGAPAAPEAPTSAEPAEPAPAEPASAEPVDPAPAEPEAPEAPALAVPAPEAPEAPPSAEPAPEAPEAPAPAEPAAPQEPAPTAPAATPPGAVPAAAAAPPAAAAPSSTGGAPGDPGPAEGQDAWSVAMRQLRRNRIAVAAAALLALFYGVAVFAPFLANGRPLYLRAHLTNVYEADVAAFEDWHVRLRDTALGLGAALTAEQRASLLARYGLYTAGLPEILGRLEGALGPEQRARFAPLRAEYEAVVRAHDPAALDLAALERTGEAIVEGFGALSLPAAYARAAGVLLPGPAWVEETEDARVALAAALDRATRAGADPGAGGDEDLDPDLVARADAHERCASQGEDMAAQLEARLPPVLAFLAPDARAPLAKAAAAGLDALRGSRDESWDAGAARAALEALDLALDAAAGTPVDPTRQLLPEVVRWPVVEYLQPVEVGFITLYLTAVALFLGRRRARALGLRGGLVALVAPALVAAGAWHAAGDPGHPPSDSLYKELARTLAETGGAGTLVFPPVPFGENENLYADRASPPYPAELLDPERASLRRRMRLASERDLPDAATAAARLDRLRIHWLGTDQNGRDVLARLVFGARVSLAVGFVAVSIYLAIGVFLGALAGYFLGWVDMALSRFTEIVMCFPSFFLIITAMAIFEQSIWNVMIVIGLTRWTEVFRLVRGEFLRLGGLDFVTAARALGFSPARVVFRHVLPNALGPVFVAAAFGVAGAILIESALSFLGFGVPPPQASWGSVLHDARGQEHELWWVTIFPGLLVFSTVTALNLVGEGLRDALDPRLRR